MEGRMDGIKAPMNIAMIVLSSLMLITTIFPWASVKGFGVSVSTLGVEAWPGVLCLLLSAGAIALACIDVTRKFSVIPNALAMIFMIVYYVKLDYIVLYCLVFYCIVL